MKPTRILKNCGFNSETAGSRLQGDFNKPIDEENPAAFAERFTEIAASSQAFPAASQPAPRVLLIEDHAALAEATAEFLRSIGLEVRIASSGHEALKSAAAFKPEIVLCDMHLPDMHGLDVLRAMRISPATKDALLAIHTAKSDMEIRMFERMQRPEVNLVLSKPLTMEKLDRLLAEREALRESMGLSIKCEKPLRKTGGL
jgi:CheY-like chemotaxis protein